MRGNCYKPVKRQIDKQCHAKKNRSMRQNEGEEPIRQNEAAMRQLEQKAQRKQLRKEKQRLKKTK